MSFDLSQQLRDIEATLLAQNDRMRAVTEALSELPSDLLLDVGDEWKDAFENAVDSRPSPAPIKFAGALRA